MSVTRKELNELTNEYDDFAINFIKNLNTQLTNVRSTTGKDKKLELLMEYYTFMEYLAQQPDMANSSQWSIIHYTKTMGDLYSIYTLLRDGMIYQSLEVLRSMTDTAFSAKYISLDPTKRGTLFVDHVYIEQYFLASDADKHQFEANYNTHKGKYKINESQGFSNGWYHQEMKDLITNDPIYNTDSAFRGKNPSIKLMAQIGGLIDLYHSVYSLGSGFTHGGSHLRPFLSRIPEYNPQVTQFVIGMTLKVLTVVVDSIINAENINTHAYEELHQLTSLNIAKKLL
ncbi:hypothetical protein KIS4809_2623 [Bacillus sp. ZZV12-4809]|nr:hypothetical protein KIS4809_2623 [Bacillus sp. ZZV12-4809]